MVPLANRLVRVLLLGLGACLLGLTPPVQAGEAPEAPPLAIEGPSPPELGEVVIADSLAGPGLAQASNCATGRNAREFVPDGYRFRVTGRCNETSTNASVAHWIDSLNVPDGEISIEWRPTAGAERATLVLRLRGSSENLNFGYFVYVNLERGEASLRKRTSEGSQTLVEQQLEPGSIDLGGWNRLAVRQQGPDFWLIMNDTPLLAARDEQYPDGSPALALLRSGNVEDGDEVSVVFRNLRISTLADTVEARKPGYLTPASSQEPAGEPWIGDIKFGSDPSGANAVPSGGRVPFDTKDVYVFFSWRNIPAGSRIGVEYRAGDETYFKDEFTPRSPDGSVRHTMFGGEASGGTGPVDFVLPKFEIILFLDGREVARGWIQPG